MDDSLSVQEISSGKDQKSPHLTVPYFGEYESQLTISTILSVKLEFPNQSDCEVLESLESHNSKERSKYLSGKGDQNRRVFALYMQRFEFRELALIDALRMFSSEFYVSGESQQVDRIISQFCSHFCNQNPKFDQEEASVLANAVILLNTDLHNPNNPRKMSKQDFIVNCQQALESLDTEELKRVYQNVKKNKIEFPSDCLKESTGFFGRFKKNRRSTISYNEAKSRSCINLTDTKTLRMEGQLERKRVLQSATRKATNRSWKQVYAALDTRLYLYRLSVKVSNPIANKPIESYIVQHALAESIEEVRHCCFSVRFGDGSLLYFKTLDLAELENWIEQINLTAALQSILPLIPICGPGSIFTQPSMPQSISPHSEERQLEIFRSRVESLKSDIVQHVEERNESVSWDARMNFLNWEMRKYQAYVNVLCNKLE